MSVFFLEQLSHNWGLALGSLFLRVKDLLSVPGLVLDSWLSIDGASADSEILLRAELKVRMWLECGMLVVADIVTK